MNKEDKLKEYYKKYQKDNREKYNQYGREYYHKYKEKFKKYYDDYKKNKIAKENGTYFKIEKPKRTKRELDKIRWERRMRKNEEKRLAFIKLLQQNGEIKPDDNLQIPAPDDNNMPPK